jgi:KamA family protein
MNSKGRPRLQFFSLHNLDQLRQLEKLASDTYQAMQVVAHVLPFRTNNYVVDELIDWDAVPHDPIFQLTFPQPGMLDTQRFERMAAALKGNQSSTEISAVADGIRRELNPHPQGQLQHNVPLLDDELVPGVQHKYRETVLVFPSAGQTCHAYCSFCFRWAQFVGMPDLKLATDESMRFCEYVRQHHEVTDVLLTGGDPLVMRADVLARYVEPLLGKDFEHVQTIRIGTKSLSYWPYRFLSDDDADQLLRLFEQVIAAGKHLGIMAHFNHWRELSTHAVTRAIARLRSTGAVIRTQSPLVRHINDSPEVWARLWQRQVQLGCIPYYLFVERDTGAQQYFKVALHRALEIYRTANQQVSGLARTARGPVMSTLPGKVMIEGVAEIAGQLRFVLSFLQARDPSWCKRPFFAEFDPAACWLTDLRPAFGERSFFYEQGLSEWLNRRTVPQHSSTDTRVMNGVESRRKPLPVTNLPDELPFEPAITVP